jgi:hypothetical protein
MKFCIEGMDLEIISTVCSRDCDPYEVINTHQQMGSSLKFLVNYQLKWFEQREKEEKKIAIQFLRF